MQKRLRRHYFLLTTVSILLTLLCTVWISKQMMEERIYAELSGAAQMLTDSGAVQAMRDADYLGEEDQFHLILLDEDGLPVYDNQADASKEASQAGLREVILADHLGEGTATRKDEKTGQTIYWYVKMLSDGSMLRIGMRAGGMLTVLGGVLPYVVACALVLLTLFAVSGAFLAERFVKPVKELGEDLNRADQPSPYPELQPFMEQIREQKEDILKNVKMRETFTANLTHELKTPLTSIIGYAQLIGEEKCAEEHHKTYSEEIDRNAERLLRMVDDALRLSELDVKEITVLQKETVSLYDLTEMCVEALRSNAEKKQVELTFEGEPYLVQADHAMMEQLVFNLIDNAIRYTDAGRKVTVQATDELVVADTGIGIPKEKQAQIFDRFYRVDKDDSRRRGGTGLGLAIVKNIVDMHGAKISVESEPGKGTIMTVQFRDAKREDE